MVNKIILSLGLCLAVSSVYANTADNAPSNLPQSNEDEEVLDLLPESPTGRTELPKERIQQDFWGRDSTKQYYLEGSSQAGEGFKSELNDMLSTLSPYQNQIGTRVNRLGQFVDEWLGDSEHFQNQRSNRLDMTFPITYRLHDQSFNLIPQFQAKIYFPNTNQRWSLMLETSKSTLISVGDKTLNTIAVQANNEERDQLNVTLQKMIVDNPYFTVRTDLGGTFQGVEPDPVAGFRLEYLLPTSDIHQNRLIQKLYWQRLKGKVLDTQYRHDWLLDDKHLVRADSQITWWHDEDYGMLSQTLGYYQSINPHRYFSYTLRSDWRAYPERIGHDSLGFGWGWRETVYQKWVFLRLSPYLNYRHDWVRQEYFFEPSITLALELSFYEVKYP